MCRCVSCWSRGFRFPTLAPSVSPDVCHWSGQRLRIGTEWFPFGYYFPREHRIASRGRVVVTSLVECGCFAVAVAMSDVGGASICCCISHLSTLPQGGLACVCCSSVPMRLLLGALFLSGRLIRRWSLPPLVRVWHRLVVRETSRDSVCSAKALLAGHGRGCL